MTFEYYPDTDTLYIALRPGPSFDATEVASDVVLDFDREGNVIGVTIEHASAKADLHSFSMTRLPALALPGQ